MASCVHDIVVELRPPLADRKPDNDRVDGNGGRIIVSAGICEHRAN